ncbi:hypothetical protein Tco_1479552, partial [Tanacetum coccineum]
MAITDPNVNGSQVLYETRHHASRSYSSSNYPPLHHHQQVNESSLFSFISTKGLLAFQSHLIVNLYVAYELSYNDGQLVVALQKCILEMGRQFLEFNLGRFMNGRQFLEFNLGKSDASLRMRKISLHQMQALLDQDKVYGVYEIHSLAKAVDAEEMRPGDMALENAELTSLERFDSLFQ